MSACDDRKVLPNRVNMSIDMLEFEIFSHQFSSNYSIFKVPLQHTRHHQPHPLTHTKYKSFMEYREILLFVFRRHIFNIDIKCFFMR